MEEISKVYFGSMSRDVHSCTHWLRPPQLPPSPRIWTRMTRSLLVSQDRRHLFVTPWFYLISQYYVSFSVAVPAAVGLLSFFSASACGFCGGPRFASARKDGVPRSELYPPPAVWHPPPRCRCLQRRLVRRDAWGFDRGFRHRLVRKETKLIFGWNNIPWIECVGGDTGVKELQYVQQRREF